MSTLYSVREYEKWLDIFIVFSPENHNYNLFHNRSGSSRRGSLWGHSRLSEGIQDIRPIRTSPPQEVRIFHYFFFFSFRSSSVSCDSWWSVLERAIGKSVTFTNQPPSHRLFAFISRSELQNHTDQPFRNAISSKLLVYFIYLQTSRLRLHSTAQVAVCTKQDRREIGTGKGGYSAVDPQGWHW